MSKWVWEDVDNIHSRIDIWTYGLGIDVIEAGYHWKITACTDNDLFDKYISIEMNGSQTREEAKLNAEKLGEIMLEMVKE